MDGVPEVMTAAQCARRIGITVRALRVYEEYGLLSPIRSAKNWRFYGARELTRLSEILALKTMGFNLSQITEMISGRDSDPDMILALQQQRLTEHRHRVEQSFRMVAALREKTAQGEILSMTDLINLAKEMQMTDVSKSDVAWKRYEQMRPRVETELNLDQLAQYVGYFRIDEVAVIEITLESDQIYLRMSGQLRVEMFAEALDQFFLKAVAAQVSFHRSDGAVSALTLHQSGLEMLANRADAKSFEQAEEELKTRAARVEPQKGSKEALRKIIAQHRAGAPDYDAMNPLLAEVVRDQLPTMMDQLDRLGETKSIEFRRVDEHGFDLFEVQFENGVMEFGLSLGTDKQADGLYMRPAVKKDAG